MAVAVDSARSGIGEDVEVVNNRSIVSDNRLAASAKNKTDASLSLEGDVEDDKLAIVDNELAIKNDG